MRTRPSSLDYACPTCKAEPGMPCKTVRSVRYKHSATLHRTRIRLYLDEHFPEEAE